MSRWQFPNGKMLVGWASQSDEFRENEKIEFSKKNGIYTTYNDFVNNPNFPISSAEICAIEGSLLLIAWEPWNWSLPKNQQPNFAPRVFPTGVWDYHITSWLKDAEKWSKLIPIVVRFAPEMNDTSRSWATQIGTVGYDEATPAEYIAMWNHVFNLKEQYAPDVQFLWNPLNYGASTYSITDFWPGIENVDMLGLNGFNWSDVKTGTTWQDTTAVFGFNDPFGPVNIVKNLAENKPWGFAEIASAHDNPIDFNPSGKYYSSYGSWVFDYPENPPYEETASDWITNEGWSEMMLLRASDFGSSFVNFFNVVKETDWRLNTTPEGRSVFINAESKRSNLVFQLDRSLDPDFQIPNIWNRPAQRFYETGIDRVVLYTENNDGVAWNGITSIQESPTGGSPQPIYVDGRKMSNRLELTDFEATIEAYTAPEEFGVCDGTIQLYSGLFVTQQPRDFFDFTYRTKVGNDVDGTDHGYKIHLIYNALAEPTEVSNQTLSATIEPVSYSWHITTIPEAIVGSKPSAHIVIDSRKATLLQLTTLEDILYGNSIMPPRIPDIAELLEIFE